MAKANDEALRVVSFSLFFDLVVSCPPDGCQLATTWRSSSSCTAGVFQQRDDDDNRRSMRLSSRSRAHRPEVVFVRTNVYDRGRDMNYSESCPVRLAMWLDLMGAQLSSRSTKAQYSAILHATDNIPCATYSMLHFLGTATLSPHALHDKQTRLSKTWSKYW